MTDEPAAEASSVLLFEALSGSESLLSSSPPSSSSAILADDFAPAFTSL